MVTDSINFPTHVIPRGMESIVFQKEIIFGSQYVDLR